jgi:hypothetical protein
LAVSPTILPSADPAQLAKLYAALGVRLEYDHVLKRVRATAENACVPRSVRRGSCPHGTHLFEVWLGMWGDHRAAVLPMSGPHSAHYGLLPAERMLGSVLPRLGFGVSLVRRHKGTRAAASCR